MDHIIVNFCPFTMNQNVLVYQNGVCVEQLSLPIERIKDSVFGLKNKYNISQIDLCGNQDYLSKIKAEMLTDFKNENCNINIYSK